MTLEPVRNPSPRNLAFMLECDSPADLCISLYSIDGRIAAVHELGTVPRGLSSVRLDEPLPPGVYSAVLLEGEGTVPEASVMVVVLQP